MKDLDTIKARRQKKNLQKVMTVAIAGTDKNGGKEVKTEFVKMLEGGSQRIQTIDVCALYEELGSDVDVDSCLIAQDGLIFVVIAPNGYLGTASTLRIGRMYGTYYKPIVVSDVEIDPDLKDYTHRISTIQECADLLIPTAEWWDNS